MKKQWLLPVGILAFSWLTACNNDNSETTTATDSTSSTMTTTAMTDGGGTTGGGMHAISESETYTDLKTGKTFRVRRDASSGRYVSESGDNLEEMYYLNPNTRDTFYGSSGRWVNNALRYDNGNYSVDEDRWNQMNAQSGSTMGGESSTMGDASMQNADKVKANENEYKAKSADGEDKVKMNENETKMKSSDGSKVKVNENELKAKSSDGTKIKANENEVKIKQKTH